MTLRPEYQEEMGDAYADALSRSGGWSVDRRTHAQEVAMVELVVVELGHGDRKRGPYLDRPEHLPDDDDELGALLTSGTRGDRALRADLFEWAELNRQVQTANACAAIAPILCYRHAGRLVDRSTPAEQRRLLTWQKEIASYLATYFEVNPDEAPDGNSNDLEAWLMAREQANNPTPEWVSKKRAPMRRRTREREDRGGETQGVVAAYNEPDERGQDDGE